MREFDDVGKHRVMHRGLAALSFRMSDFKKLAVWQKARELTVNTIRACEEISGATGSLVRSQLVRAIMSVPANIAEGSAKQSDREFARFLRISLGSITEAESHVINASDLELIDADDFASLSLQIEDVRKMLTGLAKRLTSDANRRAGKKAGRR